MRGVVNDLKSEFRLIQVSSSYSKGKIVWRAACPLNPGCFKETLARESTVFSGRVVQMMCFSMRSQRYLLSLPRQCFKLSYIQALAHAGRSFSMIGYARHPSCHKTALD